MTKNFLLLFLCFTFALAPIAVEARPAAGVAGILSVVPGLGQVANGNTWEGIAWFGATGALYLIHPFWGLNLHEYNVYDAYRDAKPRIGLYKNHNILENYIAVFNPLNLIDPIGGPLLYLYGIGWKGQNIKNVSLSGIAHYHMVGLGEEALFRGFLFPAFTDVFKSKLFGALISSLIFGLVHTQYNFKERMVVAAFGLVECWQANNNDFDLRKNMFTHSWVDIFIGDKTLSTKGSLQIGARWNTRF